MIGTWLPAERCEQRRFGEGTLVIPIGVTAAEPGKLLHYETGRIRCLGVEVISAPLAHQHWEPVAERSPT
jgi:hypothetical protein